MNPASQDSHTKLTRLVYIEFDKCFNNPWIFCYLWPGQYFKTNCAEIRQSLFNLEPFPILRIWSISQDGRQDFCETFQYYLVYEKSGGREIYETTIKQF